MFFHQLVFKSVTTSDWTMKYKSPSSRPVLKRSVWQCTSHWSFYTVPEILKASCRQSRLPYFPLIFGHFDALSYFFQILEKEHFYCLMVCLKYSDGNRTDPDHTVWSWPSLSDQACLSHTKGKCSVVWPSLSDQACLSHTKGKCSVVQSLKFVTFITTWAFSAMTNWCNFFLFFFFFFFFFFSLFFFSQKIGFDILCKLSPQEKNAKCQSLLSGKKKKK